MRRLLLVLLFTLPLEAAILRGTAVENSTGKVLARTRVSIAPLPGTAGATLSVPTDSYGSFAFLNLPAGAYLVSAARRGFAPIQYGQKRWGAPGTPVILEQEQSVTVMLRLPRFGAISGFVVDENDVGLPEHEVLAYRNTRPPRVVAKASTDDRGYYRIWGLEPGSYLVRSGGRHYPDGDYLPTFARETLRVDEAAPVPVSLDEDTPDVRVQPVAGKLLSIAGHVWPCLPGQVVTLTLVSDMGRETLTTGGTFAFHSKPPGQYEIYAEAPPEGKMPACGAYTPLALEDHPRTDVNVSLVRRGELRIVFEGIDGVDPGRVPIRIRRKDLAGVGEPAPLRVVNGSAALNPGRYELRLDPSPAYVATGFSGSTLEVPDPGRPDGWVEIVTRGFGTARWTLSDKPGAVHGTVNGPGHDTVAGAPVLLEPWDAIQQRRVGELRTVRADVQGRYRIDGLAPGWYRILSTLDVESPEPDEFTSLTPRTFQAEAGRDQQMDLDLSVLR